jgi:hypothetical protein
MLNRRQFALVSAMGVLAPKLARAQTVQTEFDQLLDSAIKDENAIALAQQEREGLKDFFDYFNTRTTAPRYSPSSRAIDPKAVALLIAFEVSSQARYERELQSPIWPKGRSGVTIGIGYDVGYVKKEWLHEDWKGILSEAQLGRLVNACEVKGQAANSITANYRDIKINWDDALLQFSSTSLPRFTAETLAVLPNATELNDKYLGAIVSLVYNRGASFRKVGARYREMRAIRRHMMNRNFASIPAELRNMKRIWAGDPKSRGLLIRRDLEATLFEEGLKG